MLRHSFQASTGSVWKLLTFNAYRNMVMKKVLAKAQNNSNRLMLIKLALRRILGFRPDVRLFANTRLVYYPKTNRYKKWGSRPISSKFTHYIRICPYEVQYNLAEWVRPRSRRRARIFSMDYTNLGNRYETLLFALQHRQFLEARGLRSCGSIYVTSGNARKSWMPKNVKRK